MRLTAALAANVGTLLGLSPFFAHPISITVNGATSPVMIDTNPPAPVVLPIQP